LPLGWQTWPPAQPPTPVQATDWPGTHALLLDVVAPELVLDAELVAAPVVPPDVEAWVLPPEAEADPELELEPDAEVEPPEVPPGLVVGPQASPPARSAANASPG